MPDEQDIVDRAARDECIRLLRLYSNGGIDAEKLNDVWPHSSKERLIRVLGNDVMLDLMMMPASKRPGGSEDAEVQAFLKRVIASLRTDKACQDLPPPHAAVRELAAMLLASTGACTVGLLLAGGAVAVAAYGSAEWLGFAILLWFLALPVGVVAIVVTVMMLSRRGKEEPGEADRHWPFASAEDLAEAEGGDSLAEGGDPPAGAPD